MCGIVNKSVSIRLLSENVTMFLTPAFKQNMNFLFHINKQTNKQTNQTPRGCQLDYKRWFYNGSSYLINSQLSLWCLPRPSRFRRQPRGKIVTNDWIIRMLCPEDASIIVLYSLVKNLILNI